MKKIQFTITGMLAIAIMFGMVSTSVLSAQRIVTHGDWQVSCDEKCVIEQGLSSTVNSTRYGIRISAVTGSNSLVAQISFPLGIYLPQGIGIKVGGVQKSVPITTCLPSGCLSILQLDDAMFKQFSINEKINIRFYLTDENPKEISFSLNGFGAAYQEMQKG